MKMKRLKGQKVYIYFVKYQNRKMQTRISQLLQNYYKNMKTFVSVLHIILLLFECW